MNICIYVSFNFISKMVVIVIIVSNDIVLIMVLIIRLLELFGVFVGEIRVEKLLSFIIFI